MASVFHQILADLNPFDGPKAAPAAPAINTFGTQYGTGGASSPDTTSTLQAQIDAANKAAADSNAAYQASQAQLAAQPKLPVFNTTAAYAQAQQQATTLDSSVYQDKLNQYLQQEQHDLGVNATGEQNAEADAASTLANQTADNATNRQRTTEDTATKTADTNQSEVNFQQDSGTAYNQARNALLGTVANSGLTTSGIGQGQVASSETARNQSDTEQGQTFDNSRRDIQTAATRTFQDLATSDTRNTSAAATTTARAKQTAQDYIDNYALDEQKTRTQNELDMQAQIAQDTNSNYSTAVQNFIQGLVGSGARAQDIQLASQVYGGS